MSVGQCFVALAIEFYTIAKQRKAAAAAGLTNGKCMPAVTANTSALNGHDMNDTVAHGLPDTPGKPSKKKE
jgi:hypothetical protein